MESLHQGTGPPVVDLDELVDRIVVLRRGGDRRLVGLVGPPGAGKSTIAAELAARLDGACVVPMDGFHLAQAVLDAAGIADRKGAPHTFDAAGFVALLRRLRDPGEGVVFAPRFDRHLEEPVAGAIPIDADVDLVIVEGNYLLLDDGPWSGVSALLDLAVHVDLDTVERVRRLVARHVAHGRAVADAMAWVDRSDEVNARLVEAARARADLVLAAGPAPAPG